MLPYLAALASNTSESLLIIKVPYIAGNSTVSTPRFLSAWVRETHCTLPYTGCSRQHPCTRNVLTAELCVSMASASQLTSPAKGRGDVTRTLRYPPSVATQLLPISRKRVFRCAYQHSTHEVVDETGRNPLATVSELPLLNKRVLVTAPRQYAQKLCSKLLCAGARPLWIPGVQITAVEGKELEMLEATMRQILQGTHTYSHIAFTSRNGIYAVVQCLVKLTGSLEQAVKALKAADVRLCALGADGDVLCQLGLPLHVSPAEASTQGLVKQLVTNHEAAGASVLCPVPHVTGGLSEPSVVPKFLKALQEAGAHPHRVPAYVTALGCTPQLCTAESGLLQNGHVHAISFSSTAEAQGLVQLMGGVEAVKAAVQRYGIVLAAHGPYTAEGAGNVLGMPVTCVSQSFKTFDGLVTALEVYFASNPKQ